MNPRLIASSIGCAVLALLAALRAAGALEGFQAG